MFRDCAMQDFAWVGEDGRSSEARSNKAFIEEVLANMRMQHSYLVQHLAAPTESNHRLLLVGFVGFYVLFNTLNRGRDLDSKLYKAVLAIRVKIPAVPLYGQAVFTLSDFIYRNMQSVGKPGLDNRVAYLKALDASLWGEVQSLHMQACQWMVRMESNFSSKVWLDEVLLVRGNLLIQGVLLAFQISSLVKTSLVLHMHTLVPIKQSNLRPIYQCAQLLKAVQMTYFRKSAMIAEQIQHIQRFFQGQVLAILDPIRSDLETQLGTTRRGGWKLDEAKLDMLSMVSIICDNLRGPNTPQRHSVVSVAWDLAPKKWVRERDQEEVKLLLRKLGMLGRLEALVGEACGCSFLFFSRGLVPLFFADCRGRWQETHQLHFLMAALRDGAELLRAPPSGAGGGGMTTYDKFERFLTDAVEYEVVKPLCGEIETDLRLRVHLSQLEQMPKRNPVREGARDLSTFVGMRPLRVLGKVIDLKAKVRSTAPTYIIVTTTTTTNL